MEIKLKSEFFKRIFNSDSISNDYSQQPLRLAIYEDSNVPLIKGKKSYANILEDYSNILANIANIQMISFNGLPNDLIREFLKIGFPAKQMMIVNSEFDFSVLDDIDSSTFEKIEFIQFLGLKNKDGKKSKFKNAKALKNLKNLNLYNCETLDLDAFFEELPNPEELSDLRISSNLPDPKTVAKFKNIKTLSIQGIANAKELYNFLESLSLEKLTVLSITDCDLKDMPESLLSRFSSLLALDLNDNRNANYNSILSALPKKDILKSLVLQDVKDNNYDLDISQLEKYIKLDYLKCANISLDFDRFREYIGKDAELSYVGLFNANVQNLDFLINARTDIRIHIAQLDIDFGMLTSEVIKKQSKLYLGRNNTGEEVELSYERINEDDLKRTSRIEFTLDDTSLSDIETALNGVDQIDSSCIRISENTDRVEDFIYTYSKKMKQKMSVISPDFSKIDEEAVIRMNRDIKLGDITVLDKDCDDMYVKSRFAYTAEQYIELRKKVKEITGDIPQDLSDIQKFMIIYRRLGSKIAYDYGIIGKNKYSKYAKDNFHDCRNGVNGLMRNTCVCAGYADILYNCLRAVGIETYKISGISGEYHQWNKVKIDGTFYNTDLTWDAPSLTKNAIFKPTWCLRGDSFFGKRHKETSGKNDKCSKDFNERKLIEALKFAYKFDGIKPPSLFQVMLNDIKEAFQDIKKEFQKMFLSKSKKALPEPTSEKQGESQASANASAFSQKTEQLHSWDLGEKTAQIQAQMAQVAASTSVKVNLHDKEIDGK